MAYARRRAPRLTAAEADLLAAAVEDMPLLLAQTAAWLDSNTMPVKDYVDQVSSGEPSQLGIGISSDYPMAFQTSWAITLNTLRERSPAAAELLKLLAFFSPEQIPVRLVQAARPGSLPEHLAALAADPIGWHTALRQLSEAAYVRLDYAAPDAEETAVGTVQMHRLYHEFLRAELPEAEQDAMERAACRVLVGEDPRRPADRREWPRYVELISHLRPAGAFDSNDPEVQELILNCIMYLQRRGEYDTGLDLIEQALDRWQAKLSPTHRTMLLIRHRHTNTLRRLGRYREAEAVGRATVESLAGRTADDSDLFTAKMVLGSALLGLARFTEAHELSESLWRQSVERLGEEHVTTLATRHNLGITLAFLGRFPEALQVQGEVLAMSEHLLRAEHPQTLSAAMLYAWTLRLLGRYTEAMSRQELNVHLRRKILGPSTPETLQAEHNLGLCLRRSGDPAQAEGLLRSVASRSVKMRGPRNPETLMFQADLATFLREHGDPDESRELAESVADRYQALLGTDHPYTVGTRGNVGLVLWKHGEREAALDIAEQALAGMTEAVGEMHPWTIGCGLNASGARHNAGDDEGAAEISRTTLARARTALGENHPLTLYCQAALADDLRGLRRHEEAGKLEQQTLQLLAETLGPRHAHTLAVRRRERAWWDFEPQPI